MKRWNGWGDDTIDYPLPPSIAHYLAELVGPGEKPKDISLEKLIGALPSSRLPLHPMISNDPTNRIRYSHGQSLPDWIAVRSGCIAAFPDGIASPGTNEDVRELISYAKDIGAKIIPYGGGTSVLGHINPLPGDSPVIAADMSHMNHMIHLDERSCLATFGAGIIGPDLEALLQTRGFTLGHFPQSFEFSTLGGWVATRSSGQQSLGYGKIEKLFAGGRLEAPAGTLTLPPFPASAAGPDLREVVLGSEGRLGILTEICVRVSPLPEEEVFLAVFLPTFEQGEESVRQIVQARLPLSMIRLSTAVETQTTLALAGHETLIGALEKYLALRGAKDKKCMLLFGFSGRKALTTIARKEALGITGKNGGVYVGKTFGKQWHKNRFRTPYLRNTLWEMGYAIDTLETATSWSNLPTMLAAIEKALKNGLEDIGERIHVFSHLSHLYPYGSSIYTTYLFRIASDHDETLRRWKVLKAAASEAIISNGGTISHHHGIGIDHKVYLSVEKGSLGMATINDLCRRFDPKGIMNPGKLI
jgi:alkyldihydroxyacetonephosphate synthase